MHLNGDNHTQNFHLGRYIFGYTFRNHVLWLRSRVAVKLNFRPISDDIPPKNINFEYGYPLNDRPLALLDTSACVFEEGF